VEARRGRQGGYRLAQQAETLPLARVLQAVEVPRRPVAARPGNAGSAPPVDAPVPVGSGAVSAPNGGGADWGEPPGADPTTLGASAGHRVEQQLRRRLARLVQLELQRLTLAELLYDQRSWEASLGPEGGVMMM
jgi:hypothetical protein